jgi:hypothetical protein
VATTYTPEAADKSTKIVFIQVMHESLDGVSAKPSTVSPGITYMDKDTTSDFFHVDYFEGEKDPYYNGDDPSDIGIQGNAQSTPKKPASTSDTPNYGDAAFPPGKSKVDWQFRTAAFSAAGPDAGKFYGYVDWTYQKEKGKAAATKVGSTSANEPGPKFMAALKLFNANHGFAMPGEASVLGGLIGGGLGALAGAGIGFLAGGPIGALVGGLVGLAAGGLIGAFGT